HAVGSGVDVDPRLLVGDPVRVLAASELDLVPGQLRQRELVGGVERHQPVLVEGDVGPAADDLAHRLRHRRLGQVTAENPVLVRADGGRLEPHRVGELGADDAHDRHHEEDDDQREPALAGHGAPTCRETVSGGSVWARPLSVVPRAIRTARGRALVCSPSHVSAKLPLSSMYWKASDVIAGSWKTTSASANGFRFGRARGRITSPGRSALSSSETTTAVKAIGTGNGTDGDCATSSRRLSLPRNRSTDSGASPRDAWYGYAEPTVRASASATPRTCWCASARSSPWRHAPSATRMPLKAITRSAPTIASATSTSSSVKPRRPRVTGGPPASAAARRRCAASRP